MASQKNEEEVRWFVMRDLKRTNAKLPAYKLLDGKKMEVFVPMKWHLVTRKGVRVREEVPFIQDLLFVHETRKNLDAVVKKTPTLQFRWLRNTWREPMVVVDADMERFIRAVNATESLEWFLRQYLYHLCEICFYLLPLSDVGSASWADRLTNTREACSRHGGPRSNACSSN